VQKAAFAARVFTAAISFLYFLVLLPHFRGITPRHFQSGWFLGGIAAALLWIPLLLREAGILRLGAARDLQLSLTSILLLGLFFALLWHETTVVR
jgi:hypothetical protein